LNTLLFIRIIRIGICYVSGFFWRDRGVLRPCEVVVQGVSFSESVFGHMCVTILCFELHCGWYGLGKISYIEA